MHLFRGGLRRTRSHVTDLVGELVDEDAVAEGGLTDLGTRTAVHGQTIASLPNDLDRALGGTGLLGEQSGEAGGMGAADGDAGA